MKETEPVTEWLARPISENLQVDGLIEGILDKFGVVSLGDLCALNLDVIEKQKGIGVKKMQALRQLIAKTRELSRPEPDAQPTSRIDTTTANVDGGSPLFFIPSLLKEAFRRIHVDTVEKLLSLEMEELRDLPSWGEKKIKTVISLQKLYKSLLEKESLNDQSPLGSLVPSRILPDQSLSKIKIANFIGGEGFSNLKGKAIQEAADLTVLLGFCLGVNQNREDFSTMDWRDLPLQVNSRVQALLDKHGIRELRDVEEVAAAAIVTSSEGQGRISALEVDNFGESSLTNLRNEIFRLKALGPAQYRAKIICGAEAIDCRELAWEDVPLQLRAKARTLLKSCNAHTIEDVHRIAVRSQVFDFKQGEWRSVGEYDGFTQPIVDELRREINRLGRLGLSGYRFGKGGRPRNCREFFDRVNARIQPRNVAIVKRYLEGRTLEQVAGVYKITRERVRQILEDSVKKLEAFKEAASEILAPVVQKLDENLFLSCSAIVAAIDCQANWEAKFMIAVSQIDCYDHGGNLFSKFTKQEVADILRLLKQMAVSEQVSDFEELRTVADLIAKGKHHPDLSPGMRLQASSNRKLPPDTALRLLGLEWIRSFVGTQLVAAGVNGLLYEEINTVGGASSANELLTILGTEAQRSEVGVFRRPGTVYSRAAEVVRIVREAKKPVDIEFIIARSVYNWHQGPLVGRYLSRLFEVVNTDRGKYIHIDHLHVSRAEVQAIANWGAGLLAGEKRIVEGQELFDRFQTSKLSKKVESAYQLVSIVAKHPQVRRLSSNLQVVHRDNFDDPSLATENVDHEFISSWHPMMNNKKGDGG